MTSGFIEFLSETVPSNRDKEFLYYMCALISKQQYLRNEEPWESGAIIPYYKLVIALLYLVVVK